MRPENPITSLTRALASATYKDMPQDIHYYEDDFEVKLFLQTWGSTALGFGGVGGASMTPAYTVIINYDNYYCVYFAGRLAYKVNTNTDQKDKINDFFYDMKNEFMMAVAGAVKRYPVVMNKAKE